MPEISVIIPTYQHGDIIARCLDSVFAQTFKDIEVIVVNDGSTDGTDEAVKPYLSRIFYKKTSNAGAPKARNLGFSLSTGKFVIFLDADIVMKPEMLERLREALERSPGAAYAYCGFRFGIARFKGESFDAERLRRVNFVHTSALIRREDFPGFDESLKRFQDWDLWLALLEKGRAGAAVNKNLFAAQPRSRFGMSQWRPKIFFSPLFEALGIKTKAVIKYREAAEVIAKKHGLDLRPRHDSVGRLYLSFLAVFVLSAAAFAWPILGTVAALSIAALTAVAASRRLVFGAAVELSELIFGSLAGKTLAIAIPGLTLPLRFVLFGIVGAVWLLRVSAGRIRLPNRRILIGIGALLAAVGWGIANGLLHGLPFRAVFSDANAYLSLPIILFFFSAVETEADQRLLIKTLRHGAIALSVLTLAALFFFSHRFWNPAGVFAYKWLRDTRIAEVTALAAGVYRIFIQSQAFCLLAVLAAAFSGRGGWKNWLWGAWPAAALLASGSRSFALGLAAAAAAFAVSSFLAGGGWERCRESGKRLIVFAALALASYVALLGLPFPPSRSQASFQDMLRSRSISGRDAATASRWSLIKELNAKIAEAPAFGSGFGTSVTYRSSDPRIISTTGGSYTTSAFEWNYHDILVKMGVLGLAAYGYLLAIILLALWKSDWPRRSWLVPAFFALLAVNAVSPYLNHPLGIGYLALLMALAERRPEKPSPVPAAVAVSRAIPAAMPSSASLSEE